VTVALEPWNLYFKPVVPSRGDALSSCGNAIGVLYPEPVSSRGFQANFFHPECFLFWRSNSLSNEFAPLQFVVSRQSLL
jgi:hypothetical protein